MPFVFKKAKIHGVLPGKCGCGHHHHVIQKQDDKKIPEVPEIKERRIADRIPSEPEWRPIHNAADSRMNEMEEQIVAAAKATQDESNRREMVQAVRNGDRSRLEVAIPFDTFDQGIEQTEDTLRFAFDEAGAAMIVHLPPSFRGVTFDSTTPRAIQIVSDRGANLVRQIGLETRNAIRKEIDKAFKEGLGADRTADNLINLIGLTERQAAAVTKFRITSLENGASIKRAQRDAKRYADRLLQNRAMVIARTELMSAANEGHLEMVRQGVDQGIIPNKQLTKIWIVTPDDRLCPWCRPMEGQQISLDEFFTSGLGPVQNPPLHPQCRCVMGIEFSNL